MNEDCRKRGLSNKKILTVVAISTLLLSSGNVIATQTTIDGSLRVTEQLQTQIVNGLVVDVNGEPVIGASVVEKGTTNGGITDINGNLFRWLSNSRGKSNQDGKGCFKRG